MKRLSFFLLIMCTPLMLWAQTADYRIIPLPKSVETDTTKAFTLTSGMGIAYDAADAEASRNALFLQQWIEELTGIRLQLTPGNKKAAIRLQIAASQLLCAHANDILQREYALKTIWIDDNYFNARSMDVYITKLRKLLKADPTVEIINIHGKGYKLIAPQVEEEA